MAKIEKLKKKYEGEWLAIEVTKEENGVSTEGKLILHTPTERSYGNKCQFIRIG